MCRHSLSVMLSRPVFTNVSAAHDTIWFECHLMRTPLSTRRGTDGRRNRDRSSKRRFLVSHCCLFRGAFGGITMAVPAGPGIQELDPVDVDEIPVVFGTRLFVVPRLRTLPAFEINAASFMQVLADDFCPPTESFHGKPLRVFLQFAALVFPSFRGGDGELCDGRTLLAVLHLRITAEISDQHYFLHGVICDLKHKVAATATLCFKFLLSFIIWGLNLRRSEFATGNRSIIFENYLELGICTA